MATRPIVIVGGGLAAGTVVTELRERGYAGPVVLLTEEPHPPYERPPLSKAYLMGQDPAEKAFVHPEEWYAEHDVELRLGARVTGIDVEAQLVRIGDESLEWDQLLLATGSRVRPFAPADDSGAKVHYLRTLGDATALKARLVEGARVAIVGGGWIGLEVAAAARTAGCEVTLVESRSLPLEAVLGREVAESFAGLHREHGVDLRTDATITGITSDGDGAATITLEDGEPVTADVLVVGVGIEPVTDLAEEAGLLVDNGIRVDERLRTSHPRILAAGDVANADHPVLGHPVRVEHWDTARQHGKVAAATLVGEEAAADALPYFFTDQYDLGMEYVGHAPPGEADRVVVRGSLEGDRVFQAYWLKGDRVLAGMHANDWDAIDDVRGVVARQVDADRLADEGVSIADV